jgi:hypothetical protein
MTDRTEKFLKELRKKRMLENAFNKSFFKGVIELIKIKFFNKGETPAIIVTQRPFEQMTFGSLIEEGLQEYDKATDEEKLKMLNGKKIN